MPGTVGDATHIALEEAGLSYERILVDFSSAEQKSEAYSRINPKQRVPALVFDDQVLTETPAILLYIAQVATTSVLNLPDDPLELAQIQSFNAYLASTVHVAHAHGARGSRWTDDDSAIQALKAYVPVSMGQCLALIESEMLQGPWVMGERYSICDPYLHTLCRWLKGDGVDIDDYPAVKAHTEAMNQRAAVQHVMNANES